MDKKEAQELKQVLKKASKSPKPYYWSLVLEGADGIPCLFIDKRENASLKQAKEARKTARKNKFSFGYIEATEKGVIFRNTGPLNPSLVQKALKKMAQKVSELKILAKISVLSVEEAESQSADSNEEIETSAPPLASVGVSTEEDEDWKDEWVEKYQQCKDLWKELQSSPYARKIEKSLVKLSDMLKNAKKQVPVHKRNNDKETALEQLQAVQKALLSLQRKLEEYVARKESEVEVPPEESDSSSELDARLFEDEDMATNFQLDSLLNSTDQAKSLLIYWDKIDFHLVQCINGFSQAVLGHPEIINDPQVMDIQAGLNRLPSRIPRKNPTITNYLQQLSRLEDEEQIQETKESLLSELHNEMERFSENPVLSLLAESQFGSYPTQTNIVKEIFYIQSVLSP